MIDYFIAHPNFITKQSIIGKLVKLDRSKNERNVEEKNSINVGYGTDEY